VPRDDKMRFGYIFLYHLVLPFIDSYWLTFIYIVKMKEKEEVAVDQILEQQVQWLAENLYDERFFHFYESCSLESIRNAITRFREMGVLTRCEKWEKRKKKVLYMVSEEYYKEDKKLSDLYEKIIFFKPDYKSVNLPKMQSELRRMMSTGVVQLQGRL